MEQVVSVEDIVIRAGRENFNSDFSKVGAGGGGINVFDELSEHHSELLAK